MTKKTDKPVKAQLKKVCKELENLLEPTDAKGNSISLTNKSSQVMEKNIKDSVKLLTEEDSISDELEEIIDYYNLEIGQEEEEEETNEEPEEPEEDEEPEEETKIEEKDPINKGKEIYTKNAIKKMKAKKLKKVATGIDIDPDDYEGYLSDLRQAVMEEMGFHDDEEPEPEEPEQEQTDEPAAKMSYSFPFLEVKATKKLQDLKDITMSDDRFKKLRKGLEEYKGLEGTKSLKKQMLAYFKEDETPEEKPTKEGKQKPVKEGKTASKSGKNQTQVIREGLVAKKSDEDIASDLANSFGKTTGQANALLKVYKKAYGVRGENDKKLQNVA